MAAIGGASKSAPKIFRPKRGANRRILTFSLCIGVITATLVPFVYFLAAIPSLQRAHDINNLSLAEVKCLGATCNTGELTTDWREGSDYVLDMRSRYFLNVSNYVGEDSNRYTPLNFSDTEFIRQFHQASSYNTPDGEKWRLYSCSATWNGRTIEIMVGYAIIAPWKMLETPEALIPQVDEKLKLEANQIAENLPSSEAPSPRGFMQKLSADGFEVVDGATGQLFVLAPPIPMRLPENKSFPRVGHQLYTDREKVYIARNDVNERIIATSLVTVGSIPWLAGTTIVAFFAAMTGARALSKRFLRDYFAIRGMQLPDLDEAIQKRESQNIEFKRGISGSQISSSRSEEELLKTIAAFANTNDGVVFIGIDDSGQIQGLQLDYKGKDRLGEKIRQLVRNRIRPVPPIQVTFSETRGLVVAKIAVARGDDPVYLLNGVIYVRDGSSDIQAQPEHLNQLFGF